MSPGQRGYVAHVAVWIGTSGWEYRHWRPGFYAGVPARAWLDHYVRHFATVELNGSFYRLPERSRFERWAERLPDGFLMAVKMSRYLTHVRRLREPEAPVKRFLDAVGGLGDHLGPVLLQLPPTLRCDAAALDRTLGCFPAGVRVAVEFRHDSWYEPGIRSILAEHRAAFVEADRLGVLGPAWHTASWRYVRFHAGRATPSPCYGHGALDGWAARLAETAGDAYVYFNNDPLGCAVHDARLFALAVARHGLDATRVPPPALTAVG